MWTLGIGGSEMLPIPYRKKKLNADLQNLKAKLVRAALTLSDWSPVLCRLLADPALQPEGGVWCTPTSLRATVSPYLPALVPRPFYYLQVNLNGRK